MSRSLFPRPPGPGRGGPVSFWGNRRRRVLRSALNVFEFPLDIRAMRSSMVARTLKNERRTSGQPF